MGFKTKDFRITKQRIVQASFLAVLIIFITAAVVWANYDKPGYYRGSKTGTLYETARVLEVIKDNTVVDETVENIRRGSMVLKVKILTGEYAGDLAETTNYFSNLYNVYVTEGDKVTVRLDVTDGTYSVSVYNYHRTSILIAFVALFMLAIIAVGRKQGLYSVLGLIFTLICVIYILVPFVIKGFPAIPTTVAVVSITTICCFGLIGGVRPKTVAAAAGTVIGVICAAALAGLIGAAVRITGFQMEEAESLLLIATNSQLKIQGLFVSGVLIAAVGAVMDTAMSISSAIEELHIKNPSMSRKELRKSGITIGRDTMGTMTNTLILAFAGSSLNMIIMIYSYGVTFTQLINTDFVAVELIRSIAGSMGIILCVPAVSMIASWIVTRKS